MFAWFGKKTEQAERGEDSVWMSDAARVQGLRREVERVVAEGNNAVVVALTMARFEQMAAALADSKPALCRDRFERDALHRALQGTGAVAIAMSGALPTEAKAGSEARGELLVYGRNGARPADEMIVTAAGFLGSGVRVTFHLSLDDALLQQHGKPLKPILEKLGMSPEAPVTSPFLTRAIANAQGK